MGFVCVCFFFFLGGGLGFGYKILMDSCDDFNKKEDILRTVKGKVGCIEC